MECCIFQETPSCLTQISPSSYKKSLCRGLLQIAVRILLSKTWLSAFLINAISYSCFKCKYSYTSCSADPFIRIPNPSDFENTNLLQLPSRSPWAARSSRASRPSFCLLRSSLFALPSAWNSLHLVTTNSIQFSSNIIKRLVQTLLLSSANNSTLSKQYLFNRTREKIKKHLNDKNTGLLLVNWRNEKRRNRGITEWKWTSSTRKMITKTEGTGSSESWHISYFCEVMHIIRRQDRDCFLPLNTSRKYFWKGNSCRNTMSNECERKKQACLRW